MKVTFCVISVLILTAAPLFAGSDDGEGATNASATLPGGGGLRLDPPSTITPTKPTQGGPTGDPKGPSSPQGNGNQPPGQPKQQLAVDQPPAPGLVNSVNQQVTAAQQMVADPFNMAARQQYMQSSVAAAAMNSKLDDLVKQGYSDKGLKELRTALAAKALAPVADLGNKKDSKESESKTPPPTDSKDKNVTINVNQNPVSLGNDTSGNGGMSALEAAAFVKDRILQDLKRSQVADPNTTQVAPSLLSSQGEKQQVDGTSAVLLRQVDTFKKPSIEDQVSAVGGTPAAKTINEGRLLYDPAKRGTSSDHPVADVTPKTEEEKEIREKIKTAAKEYLGKLAKAPDSGNPREASLQQAIRLAQEDENVYDGLLNEIAAAFESDRLTRMTSYVPQDSINSPIEANPVLAGRNPASLDSINDGSTNLRISPSKRGISWPSSETKIPLLIAMAILLAVLVVWSSQGKPNSRS